MLRSLIIPISLLASFGLSSAASAEQGDSATDRTQTVLIAQAPENELAEKTEDDEKEEGMCNLLSIRARDSGAATAACCRATSLV